MPTLSQLISRSIARDMIDSHNPTFVTLSAPIQPRTTKQDGQYEAEVFNFLLANKVSLGIKAVMMFTAVRVDGAVELIDGRRLTVEVKFRMNWEQACKAEWQFWTFMKRTKVRPFSVDSGRPFTVDGGIVVFDEFSGPWDRQAACRVFKDGWARWYEGHADVDGVRLDLLRLHGGKLEGFPG